MEKTWCVYRHTCPNDKVYIGITSNKPEIRWAGGIGYQFSNRDFFNYIMYVGWKNIKHEVLFTELTESEARQKEIQLIKEASWSAYNIIYGNRQTIDDEIPDSCFCQKPYTACEIFAIKVWAIALFGKETDGAMLKVSESNYYVRTAYEFSSGDDGRIRKEISHIDSERMKIGKGERIQEICDSTDFSKFTDITYEMRAIV